MTKKQKVVFAVVAAVVAAVLVPGIILSYVCYHFIYGTRITSREGEAYHKLEGKGVYSPLAVFPSADMDTVSQDFYYQTRDEIFAATCQIYLENQYTREQYGSIVTRVSRFVNEFHILKATFKFCTRLSTFVMTFPFFPLLL